jgi:septal ring factor EnvC (AmiA/AmiB activator)
MRCRAVVRGGVVLLGFLGVFSVSDGQDPGTLQEKKKELQELKKGITEERKKAKESAAKEAQIQTTLKRIDQQLRQKTAELKELEAKLRAEERAIVELNREVLRVERELQQTKERWAHRLRALYKQGQFGVFRLLLSAENLTDMALRVKYLGAITAHDRALSEHYATMVADLGQKQGILQARRAALAKNRNQVRATQEEIAEEKWRQRILLAKVREEKQGHLTAIRELEEASTQLQQLINQLQKRETAATATPPLPTGPFTTLKGKLPWPTDGELSVRFGRQEHPKFKTVTFNKGIGIHAPLGQEILAVYDGTVVYADWFRGYGKLIILDHSQGFYTLYAHASDLFVPQGETVRAGQAIGRVGETGSLEGPQLYFELRYQGIPQDPLVWLNPRP